ncbi:hypothetical protein PENTCL1PPCAC_24758, partial [Pristionchus entomophagus]
EKDKYVRPEFAALDVIAFGSTEICHGQRMIFSNEIDTHILLLNWLLDCTNLDMDVGSYSRERCLMCPA